MFCQELMGLGRIRKSAQRNAKMLKVRLDAA
jgi:hypothetical protein